MSCQPPPSKYPASASTSMPKSDQRSAPDDGSELPSKPKLLRTSRRTDVVKEVNHPNITAPPTSNKADAGAIPVHNSAPINDVYDIVDKAALQQASNSAPWEVYQEVATHPSSTVSNKINGNRPTNVTSPAVVGDSVTEDGDHHADADIPHRAGSDRMVSSGGFKPSIKLMSRMEKLVRKRIDPSSITFLESARQFHGGHATVSEARLRAQEMGRWGTIREEEVAVKIIRLADNTDLERALGLAIREAELLAELYFPNIVKFSGFVEDVSNNVLWLVFPWAHNSNLKDFISLINWEIPERISLINDVAQGLEYLHSRKPPICHGDLKSPNVLVDRYRRAAITDFGSARRLSQGDSKPPMELVESEARGRSVQPPTTTFCPSTNTITLTGNKYTLRWAAPELLNEDQLSLWSDIWSLGWIAYEVMTNSIPFHDASSDIIVVQNVLGGKLPSLADNDHLSVIHELCWLMTMCWKFNPTERPTADHCLKSIKMMPKFVPDFDPQKPRDRSLSAARLIELGYMYRSRGEYARAFESFAKALEKSRKHAQQREIISSLRNLAQIHRLRNEYSEAVVLYSEVWEVYAESVLYNPEDIADDLCELAQLRDESCKAFELDSERRETEAENRIAKALCKMARQPQLQTQYDKAIGLYSGALGIWTDLGDRKGRASALSGLAGVHLIEGHYDKTIPLYSEALEIWTDLTDSKDRTSALWGLAEAYRLQGQYDQAIPLYSEALEIWTDLGNQKARASTLLGLAEVHRLQGQYDEAIPLYSAALEIWTDLIDGKDRASALWSLAEVYRLQGQYDKAIPLYSETLKIWADLGNDKGRASALLGLAEVHGLQAQYDEAIPLYSEALEIWTDLKDKTSALLGLAEMHRLQGQYDEAIPLYSEAVETWTHLIDGKDKTSALWGLAESYRLQGQSDKAIPLYSETLKIWTDFGNNKGRASALLGLAEVHRLQAQYDQAIPLYSEALEIWTDLGNQKARASTLLGFAEVHRLRGQYDEASPLYSEALEIWTDLTDREDTTSALWGLAEIYQLLSQYDIVISLYSDALAIYTCLDDHERTADALWGLATAHQIQGQYNQSILSYNLALDIWTDLGDRKGRASALVGLATVHSIQGQYHKAISLYSEAFLREREQHVLTMGTAVAAQYVY